MGLNRFVEFLFARWKHVKIHLCGRRHGLNQVLQWIFIDPAPQIEQQCRFLRIRQKQRVIVSLLEIFADRLVVGKIAIVHERLVECAERMAAAGMPDPAARRIALVGEPCVGLEIIQLVVPDDVFGITNDLQDHHVPAMGHDKGLFLSERSVVPRVDSEAVLIDKLVLSVPSIHG